jgi:hypothetical protein
MTRSALQVCCAMVLFGCPASAAEDDGRVGRDGGAATRLDGGGAGEQRDAAAAGADDGGSLVTADAASTAEMDAAGMQHHGGSGGASGDAGSDADLGMEPVVDAGPLDSGVDAGDPTPVVVNGCEDFVDRSAVGAQRSLDWTDGLQNVAARCMRIRAGQSVEFDGDLNEHPLAALGGDTPSPVDGSDNVVVFSAPGLFGYYCVSHPEMNGAIQVDP